MKISIVIPVYNVQKYLQKCIDSLLKQKVRDMEIILVDDGSTDKSGEICDFNQKQDGRIQVIHKKNGGVPSARNAGIKAATGDYILFVDSDDYINGDYFLEHCCKCIEKRHPDVLIYGCTRADLTKKIFLQAYENIERINELEEKDKLKWLVDNDKFSISAWMHMVNTDFLKRNGIYFDETYRNGEDIEWIYHLFINEPKLCAINDCSYIYQIRPNSLCTSKRESGFWRYRFRAIERNIIYIEECKASYEYKMALYEYLAYQYYVLVAEISEEPNKLVKKCAIDKLKKFECLRTYHGGRKVNLSKRAVDILGVRYGGKILNIMASVKKKYFKTY